MQVQHFTFNSAGEVAQSVVHFGLKDAGAYFAEMEASARSGLPYYMSIDGKFTEMTDPAPHLAQIAAMRARFEEQVAA